MTTLSPFPVMADRRSSERHSSVGAGTGYLAIFSVLTRLRANLDAHRLDVWGRSVLMRAAVINRENRIDEIELPEPEVRAGWVTISVSHCGICGSDLHFLNSPLARDGLVMGHEFSGSVEAVGDGAAGLERGDRVTVLPAERCAPDADDRCVPCRTGASQRCVRQTATSLGIALPGGFAERVSVPASSCVHLPDDMPFEAGAIVEPLAVALHGIGMSSFEAGMCVGVIGAGPIGLLSLLALRALGAGKVVVAEPSQTRATLAESLGADVVLKNASGMSNMAGGPPEVVIECAGRVDTPSQAILAVRSGGEVILVGVTDPQDQLQIASIFWVIKEVTVRGAIAYTNDEFAQAVSLLAGRQVEIEPLITDIRPLADAQRSFDELSVAGSSQVKILLSPAA